MSEIVTITFNPKENCCITLDHYMDLVEKANDYDNLMELLRKYEAEKEGKTKWII